MRIQPSVAVQVSRFRTRVRILLACAVIATGVVACGGGGSGDAVIHMDGYDTTESAMKVEIRAQLAKNMIGSSLACNQFKGLSLSEAVAYIDKLPNSSTPETPIAGSTPKPGQVADAHAKERSVAILMDECNHLFPK